MDMDKEAYIYAMEKVRENNKKNPCGLCEEVDGCEYCEYYENKKEE